MPRARGENVPRGNWGSGATDPRKTRANDETRIIKRFFLLVAVNNASLEVALRELSEISAVSACLPLEKRRDGLYTEPGRKVLIARNAEIDEVNERELASKGLVSPRFIEITYRALGEKKSGQELPLNLLRRPP